MRIKTETFLVILVRKQVVHLVFHNILIIRKFIPTQASTAIIVATQVMKIMHGDSLVNFELFSNYQVLVRLLLLPLNFIETVTIKINFIKTISLTFFETVTIIKKYFLLGQFFISGYDIIIL